MKILSRNWIIILCCLILTLKTIRVKQPCHRFKSLGQAQSENFFDGIEAKIHPMKALKMLENGAKLAGKGAKYAWKETSKIHPLKIAENVKGSTAKAMKNMKEIGKEVKNRAVRIEKGVEKRGGAVLGKVEKELKKSEKRLKENPKNSKNESYFVKKIVKKNNPPVGGNKNSSLKGKKKSIKKSSDQLKKALKTELKKEKIHTIKKEIKIAKLKKKKKQFHPLLDRYDREKIAFLITNKLRERPKSDKEWLKKKAKVEINESLRLKAKSFDQSKFFLKDASKHQKKAEKLLEEFKTGFGELEKLKGFEKQLKIKIKAMLESVSHKKNKKKINGNLKNEVKKRIKKSEDVEKMLGNLKRDQGILGKVVKEKDNIIAILGRKKDDYEREMKKIHSDFRNSKKIEKMQRLADLIFHQGEDILSSSKKIIRLAQQPVYYETKPITVTVKKPGSTQTVPGSTQTVPGSTQIIPGSKAYTTAQKGEHSHPGYGKYQHHSQPKTSTHHLLNGENQHNSDKKRDSDDHHAINPLEDALKKPKQKLNPPKIIPPVKKPKKYVKKKNPDNTLNDDYKKKMDENNPKFKEDMINRKIHAGLAGSLSNNDLNGCRIVLKHPHGGLKILSQTTSKIFIEEFNKFKLLEKSQQKQPSLHLSNENSVFLAQIHSKRTQDCLKKKLIKKTCLKIN